MKVLMGLSRDGPGGLYIEPVQSEGGSLNLVIIEPQRTEECLRV